MGLSWRYDPLPCNDFNTDLFYRRSGRNVAYMDRDLAARSTSTSLKGEVLWT